MKSICGNIYLKAPQGPSMSFPQYHWMTVQSLENLKETDRETLNKHRVCSCVCLCVRGDGNAAAVRPSIIAVKSMPNEDADAEARTLTHTERTNRGEFLTPLIIPPIIHCFRRNVSPASLHRQAADRERAVFSLLMTEARVWAADV